MNVLIEADQIQRRIGARRQIEADYPPLTRKCTSSAC